MFAHQLCEKVELIDSLDKYEAFESFERENWQIIPNSITMYDFNRAPEVLVFRLSKRQI